MTTWNTEWATLGQSRGLRIANVLAQTNSDFIVITEASRSLLPAQGPIAEGSDDWGYEVADKERRKVLLWSRFPLQDIDRVGHTKLPSGRFVAATALTPLGRVRVVGVCIPWSGAHVSSGQRNRTRWEDHNTYLVALRSFLAGIQEPLILAGDFNQRIPRHRQPTQSFDLMMHAIEGLVVHTSDQKELPLIDHIATSQHFTSTSIRTIEKHDGLGTLSDHRGVLVDLRQA